MTDKALKPCPFCGSDAHLCQSDDGRYYSVFCDNDRCGANVGEDFYMEKDELVSQWNTRPQSEEIRAVVEEMRQFADGTYQRAGGWERFVIDFANRIEAAIAKGDV